MKADQKAKEKSEKEDKAALAAPAEVQGKKKDIKEDDISPNVCIINTVC
jgi:hypothetical protein